MSDGGRATEALAYLDEAILANLDLLLLADREDDPAAHAAVAEGLP